MRRTTVRPPDLLPAEPHVSGPTWRRLRDGSFYLPGKTLGWAIINWMHAWLRDPEDTERPFLPTQEQARFILWWYAVDENGRYAYRNGVLRRMKGWGKDPLLAAICLAELCGPVQFAGFDETGEPIGKLRPAAWIQIAALTGDQNDNTFMMFGVLASDLLKAEHSLDINKTIIYRADGGKIQSMPGNPLALEGKRPTFVVLNEIQWWKSTNNGHAMFGVVSGNITKRSGAGARYLAICNGHRPGEDSVGERLWDAYQAVQAGHAVDTRMLYDTLEAPAGTPISEIPSPRLDPEGHAAGVELLRQGLLVARGDSVWLDVDAIIEDILGGATGADKNVEANKPSEDRRKYLNQINAAEDAWMDPDAWRAAERPGLVLKPGEKITLGFDGSKTRDWTALVACRIDDGALFVLDYWVPEQYGGEIPRESVDARVRWAWSEYKVVAMRADVKEFEAYVDGWSRDFGRKVEVNAAPGHPIAFDMRGQTKRFAAACEAFLDGVYEGSVIHDGNGTLRSHVLNAKLNPTTYGTVSIRKATRDSPRKIDAAVCAVLASSARQEYLMKKNRTGKAVVFK